MGIMDLFLCSIKRVREALQGPSWLWQILLGAILLSSSGAHSRAAGTVTVCDETSLRAAMQGGGTVTFACDGTITLSSTILVTNDTVLDSAGRHVTISGGTSVRILEVNGGT